MKKVLCTLISVLLALTLTVGIAVFAEDGAEAAESSEAAETAAEAAIRALGEPVSDYKEDFESYAAGTDFSEIEELQEKWIVTNALSDYTTKVVNTAVNGNYLYFRPFAQMYLEDGIVNKYVFSFDAKVPANQGFGIFFRSSGEADINPYFEDDNSGFGIQGIGPSGIFIIPSGTKVKVFVKFCDENNDTVSTIS